MATVYCLDCDRKIVLNLAHKPGDSVSCTSCGAEFEIVSMDPPELEWLYEDYDDAYDDDEPSDTWYEDNDDEDWVDSDEDWSWMLAKQQRLQTQTASSRRRRQEFDRE